MGEAVAHPGVRGKVDTSSGGPGKDVLCGAGEVSERTVGSAHASHWLSTGSVRGVLTSNLLSRHTLGLRVQPDGTMIFSADTGKRWFIGCLESNAGVVTTAPSTSGTRDSVISTCIIHIFNGISKVSLSTACVVGNYKVCAVHLS